MEQKRTEVNELGEFGLIKHLTHSFENKNATSIKGVGDDAAIIDAGDDYLVVSTDLLMENIHFDLTYAPLKHVGYKAVVVNLSDIYSMNAIPQQITFSLAFSNRFSVEALEELYAGVKLACDHYNVDLVGGDTTSSLKGLLLSVTAIGRVPKSQVVYRNTAQVNDAICVTGDLGGAYLGLQLLEREKQVFLANPNMQPQFDNNTSLIKKLLKPEARKDIIEALAKADILPTSMMDISDGLSSELMHICAQSNVGCTIYEEQIPIFEDTYNQAIQFEIDPLNCALSGGDEYELLFTVHPDELEKVLDIEGVSHIGNVRPASVGKHIVTKGGNQYELKALGWTHF
ncbi:MAG: thiamine-phosphate kinase [Saprospiraceae bacterium]|nr:thiamine-phosphate kinase [Saprospiraceae bacterium]